MLPFLKRKDAASPGLIVKTRTPDQKPDSEDQDARKACGDAILAAIASNDGLALMDALEMSDTKSSVTPHSYDSQNESGD